MKPGGDQQGQPAATRVPEPRRRPRLPLRLLEEYGEPLLALLGRTADPDAALSGLLRLREALDDPDALLRALVDDEGTAMRLLCVLGASEALLGPPGPAPGALARAHRRGRTC